jgi:hypothetical protein
VLPEDKLTFSVDYTRTYWSEAIIRNYNNAATDERQLDIYFPTLTPTNAPAGARQLDTEQLRFGLEYIYMADEIIIPFRLGLFTDSQFYRDAAGEEIMFIGITGGVGVKWGPLSVDVALMYETGKYLESNVAYSSSTFDEFKIYVSTIFSL